MGTWNHRVGIGVIVAVSIGAAGTLSAQPSMNQTKPRSAGATVAAQAMAERDQSKATGTTGSITIDEVSDITNAGDTVALVPLSGSTNGLRGFLRLGRSPAEGQILLVACPRFEPASEMF